MHTTIDYTRYGEDVKRAEALKDCREWLSKKQWKALKEYANHPGVTQRAFAFGASIAGIQGFPVTVLWTYFSGKEWNDAQA